MITELLLLVSRYDRRHGSRDRHHRHHGGGGGGPGSITGGDTDRDTVVSIQSAPPTRHPGQQNHGCHLNHNGNGDGEGGERIEVYFTWSVMEDNGHCCAKEWCSTNFK